VDETLLTVHIKPYFLRLNFSNSLVEDDASSAHYDPASGYLTLTLTKEVKGQNFADLDLLSKLLSPRPSAPGAPKIQVLSGEESPVDQDTSADLDSKFDRLSLERQELLEGLNPLCPFYG
jgi:protein SHQ1